MCSSDLTLSKKAVAHAIQLAALSGAELMALRVTPRYPQSYFEGSLPLGPQEVAKIERQWATEAQASVDLVKKQGEAKGVKVKATVSKSDVVSDAVILAAKRAKVDLIVMASHNKRKFVDYVLGPNAEHVVHHSKVSVMIVR